VKFLSLAEIFAGSQGQLDTVFANDRAKRLLVDEIRLLIRWLRARVTAQMARAGSHCGEGGSVRKIPLA
jgi:hypothetical protein